MYMNVLFVCISVHHVHACSAHKGAEAVRCSRTRVADGCELPYGFWQLNLGSLEDQSGLSNS